MIRSTFFGFGTAMSAMNAAQRALDVTGHNIGNMNTTGYTRQRLDLYSSAATSAVDRYTSRSNFAIGQGVEIGGVSQMRDPFLDIRFRREAASVGEYDTQLGFLNDITGVFDEVQTKKLQSAFADFRTQLQGYAGQTNMGEMESIVRSSAESLIRGLNQWSKQLSEVREQQVYNQSNDVDRINDIMDKLGTLNQSIKESELFGNQALELKDERNMLIDELSTYMDIEVSYQADTVNPNLNNIVIKAKGNDGTTDKFFQLVNNEKIGKLEVSLNAATGMYEYGVKEAGAAADAAASTVTFRGGALNGYQEMLNSSGEFDAPDAVRGVGYYEKMLDRVASEFAQMFNEANDDGTIPKKNLFENSTDGTDVGITAGNIAIAKGWADGDYTLTASKPGGPGAGDTSGKNENINHMITLLDKEMEFKSPGGAVLFKGTVEGLLTKIGNVAASETSSKTTILGSHVSVLSGIEDLRDGISAVSLDEEGVNLLRFQKSYAAAARFMTTLDEALDVIINKMGIVGR